MTRLAWENFEFGSIELDNRSFPVKNSGAP
jgi:hypothetical protein